MRTRTFPVAGRFNRTEQSACSTVCINPCAYVWKAKNFFSISWPVLEEKQVGTVFARTTMANPWNSPKERAIASHLGLVASPRNREFVQHLLTEHPEDAERMYQCAQIGGSQECGHTAECEWLPVAEACSLNRASLRALRNEMRTGTHHAQAPLKDGLSVQSRRTHRSAPWRARRHHDGNGEALADEEEKEEENPETGPWHWEG